MASFLQVSLVPYSVNRSDNNGVSVSTVPKIKWEKMRMYGWHTLQGHDGRQTPHKEEASQVGRLKWA